mmetsp:Transcript_31062/g.48424  ORF Transcript_31062/g.48424 Transcript_31062/m.48424 type:complete len:455 (-) Transcript_31062:64-1428(-)
MKCLFFIVVAVLFSFVVSRDYTVEVRKDLTTNAIFVEKNSAISRYTGKVTYQGEGTGACAWTFCATRSFRGILTNLKDNTERVLTETEGCLLINDANITDDEGGAFGGSLLTDPFAWNAEGEFYLNGQLIQGDCSASLTVTGSECEDRGEFNFGCDPIEDFPPPAGEMHLEPNTTMGDLIFGLSTTGKGNELGMLKMVMNVGDLDSDGMGVVEGDVGYVRLLLNGIPTENDYDFEVPLMAPTTELSIAAARRDSDYFYSVEATENVTVALETLAVMDCDGMNTYGPNCSITARVLGADSDDVGVELTFDPTTDSNCYTDVCYFSLANTNMEVTVKPAAPEPTQNVAVLYKANNFPTVTDYDVATPGDTSFIPDFFQTFSTTQFAVFSRQGRPFTVFLGHVNPSPPPTPGPSPSDDELPWAWIGVSIALGVIIIAGVIAGAVFYFKTPKTYVTVE